MGINFVLVQILPKGPDCMCLQKIVSNVKVVVCPEYGHLLYGGSSITFNGGKELMIIIILYDDLYVCRRSQTLHAHRYFHVLTLFKHTSTYTQIG